MHAEPSPQPTRHRLCHQAAPPGGGDLPTRCAAATTHGGRTQCGWTWECSSGIEATGIAANTSPCETPALSTVIRHRPRRVALVRPPSSRRSPLTRRRAAALVAISGEIQGATIGEVCMPTLMTRRRFAQIERSRLAAIRPGAGRDSNPRPSVRRTPLVQRVDMILRLVTQAPRERRWTMGLPERASRRGPSPRVCRCVPEMPRVPMAAHSVSSAAS